jgi:tRNA threonylcarbamoyladenosine biosynthesis protein TsaE
VASNAERTTSAAGTEAVGARIATDLRPGDVVLISGDLGAGKTTLVRGALRALGVTEPVTSPTFTLARRYATAAGDVSHLDLHRLAGAPGEDDDLLLADELGPDRIAFVEWPEMGEAVLGAASDRIRVRVRLEHDGGDARRVTVGP